MSETDYLNTILRQREAEERRREQDEQDIESPDILDRADSEYERMRDNELIIKSK